MAPRVYSYSRWSTKEQLEGDSDRRQLAAAHAYAAEHGMVVDEELKDDGRSAFRGRNVRGGEKAGALGRFLELVEAGEIERGSVLILEDLDRMSRQSPDLALDILLNIVRQGVAVHTTSDKETYTVERIRSFAGTMTLMRALLAFSVAHQESEKKASRLREVWAEKRRKAVDRPMTAQGPGWLRLDKETRQWEMIPERVNVVRRIFTETLAGKGVQTVARELNEDGVPVFGEGKRKGLMWHRTYILKILHSPTVVGTLVPHMWVTDVVTGKRERKPLPEIPGYYPAVVSTALFDQVQTLRTSAPNPQRGKAASGIVQNLFGGLVRCARCGSSMHRESKGIKEKTSYLICSRAKSGAGCRYELVRYADLEQTFLSQAGAVIDRGPVEDGADVVDEELAQVTSAIEAIDSAISDIRQDLAAGAYSPSLSAQLRELSREKDRAEQERNDLRQRALKVARPFLNKRLSELTAALNADPIDRARANALLRVLCKSVLLDLDTGLMTLVWEAGGEAEVPVTARGFGFPVEPKKPKTKTTKGSQNDSAPRQRTAAPASTKAPAKPKAAAVAKPTTKAKTTAKAKSTTKATGRTVSKRKATAGRP